MLVSDPQHERPNGRRRYFPKPLLTEAEAAFWERLRRVVPDFVVLPQVAMGALVDPPRRLTGEYREKARRRFQSKIIDFTVYDPAAAKVVCLVELDDPSHDDRLEHDVERDALTLEAGYITLRWDVRTAVSDDELTARILQAAQFPDMARQRALTEHAERRVLAEPVEQPKDNVILLGERLPRGYRTTRPCRSEPSTQRVLVTLVALLIFGVIGYFALPHIMMAFLNQMSRSVTAPKQATPTAAPPGRLNVAVINPAGSLAERVFLDILTCVAYGNPEGSAQAQAAGCPQAELVLFSPGRTIRLIEAWARFNDARLDPSAACPPYGNWSQENPKADGTGGGRRVREPQRALHRCASPWMLARATACSWRRRAAGIRSAGGGVAW